MRAAVQRRRRSAQDYDTDPCHARSLRPRATVKHITAELTSPHKQHLVQTSTDMPVENGVARTNFAIACVEKHGRPSRCHVCWPLVRMSFTACAPHPVCSKLSSAHHAVHRLSNTPSKSGSRRRSSKTHTSDGQLPFARALLFAFCRNFSDTCCYPLDKISQSGCHPHIQHVPNDGPFPFCF